MSDFVSSNDDGSELPKELCKNKLNDFVVVLLANNCLEPHK